MLKRFYQNRISFGSTGGKRQAIEESGRNLMKPQQRTIIQLDDLVAPRAIRTLAQLWITIRTDPNETRRKKWMGAFLLPDGNDGAAHLSASLKSPVEE